MVLNKSQGLINAASVSCCRLRHEYAGHLTATDGQLLGSSARGATVHHTGPLTLVGALLCIIGTGVLTKGPVHDAVAAGGVFDKGTVHEIVGSGFLDVGPVHGGCVLAVRAVE